MNCGWTLRVVQCAFGCVCGRVGLVGGCFWFDLLLLV